MVTGDWPELVAAEALYRRVLDRQPANASVRAGLGFILHAGGRSDEARIEANKALRASAHTEDSDTLFLCGTIAASEGRFSEAEDFFRLSQNGVPNQKARALLALSTTRKLTPADGEWLIRAEQDLIRLPSDQEVPLRFALGKFHDDIGQYAEAFHHYQRGNALLKARAPAYLHWGRESFVRDMMRVYTAETLARASAESTSDSTKPILVVGLPRTGTTLTEQILASHSAVASAGESAFWLNAGNQYKEDLRSGILTSRLRQGLRDDYLGMLSHRQPAYQHVIDKTNAFNTDYLGLFHSVFPRAKIIYLRRDPIDSCLSCYFQPFHPRIYNWTFDLADLANYYTEHARLVAHWRSVLPSDSMLEVPYEELVTRQEHWTRKMLEFLGLDFDARCMDFHKTERTTVVNVSQWQVRQPMYRHSLQRSRNYLPFVGPLADLVMPIT